MVRQAPIFKTLESMENWYYGDLNADMIKKVDAHLTSASAGLLNVILGAKVWSQINYEKNAFAGVPKEPWIKTGWRVETAIGGSVPSGGLAEGNASNATDLPDTLAPTLATITAPMRMVGHTWGSLELAALKAGVDDSAPLSHFREQIGRKHARNISAYLVQDADTPPSNGFESLDRVACSSDETANALSAASDGDIYNIDRDNATTYDAQVSYSGTATAALRDLTLSLIDGVWTSITNAGGMPKVIFTGANTIKVWQSLLEAERRFMNAATFIPRFNGAEGTTPGVEGGFSVASYHNVPIIPCQDYDSSLAAARTGEIAPLMFADTDFVRFAVARPTQYNESSMGLDTILLEEHKVVGLITTVGELRCYNFVAQGKLRDIK